MDVAILLGDPIFDKKNPGMFEKIAYPEILVHFLDILKKVFRAKWRYFDKVSKYPTISSKYKFKKYAYRNFPNVFFGNFPIILA